MNISGAEIVKKKNENISLLVYSIIKRFVTY